MKVAKHAKVVSLARNSAAASKKTNAAGASKEAIARAQNYLTRSHGEFVAIVESNRKTLMQNEVGLLAGKTTSRTRLR